MTYHLVKRLVVLFSICLLFISPLYAAETYQFEPNHTYVQWSVNHFGFSTVQGRLPATGILVLDEANPQNSQVKVIIDTANLSTGVRSFDDMLQGGAFFDVSQYPQATFVSNKVEVHGKSATIYGILTLRGISQPIVLNIRLNKMGIEPYFSKKAVGFSGTATLKRSEFHMGGFTPGVSDVVKLELEAEALLVGGG